MKNIMILITKLSNGGAEKASIKLAESLSKRYNVYLTVFDNSNQDYETNIKIIDLKTTKTHNLFKRIINCFKRVHKVRKLKKQYKIDCTISFLAIPNLVNVLSKKNNKAIISIRNNLKEKSKLRNIVNKFAMKRADKVVTVAEEMRKYHIQHDKVNPNRIVTIYNICNLEKLQNEIEGKEIKKYKEIFMRRKHYYFFRKIC